MAGDIAVGPTELIAVAGWLDQVAREVGDAVENQMREVRAFVGVEWQGVAATSHEDPWAEWENGARRIVNSFGTDAGLLRRAADEFASTDGAHEQAIDAAGSSLDLPPVMSS